MDIRFVLIVDCADCVPTFWTSLDRVNLLCQIIIPLLVKGGVWARFGTCRVTQEKKILTFFLYVR